MYVFTKPIVLTDLDTREKFWTVKYVDGNRIKFPHTNAGWQDATAFIGMKAILKEVCWE